MVDLTKWMMVFLRAGAMMSVFPVFSIRNIPVQLRVGISALIALMLAPVLLAPPAAVDGWGLLGMMLSEVGVGLLLGFVSRMIFYALEMAGDLVSTQMGLALPANFNPATQTQSTALSTLFFYLGAVLWVSLNLHRWMLIGFGRSYDLVPMGVATLGEGAVRNVLGITSRLFVIGLQLAAPVVAVSFLVTLVFAILGRAVPQMNVFFESFAFRILAGLIMLGATLHVMAQQIANYLRRLPEDFLRVAQLLGT